MSDLVKSGRIVTVFGGSGFVGRHVVRALARDGWRVRVATRRPDLAFHLQPLGRSGQISPVQANVRYPASVAAALRGADAAVNLVAVLQETGRQSFEATIRFGARAVARAAAEAGIASLVHVSAIGADPHGISAYARAKGRAEEELHEACPNAVVLRPSVIFGPEDQFLNRFATLARVSPILPLFGGGATRMQPVFVGDVADAVAAVLRGAGQPGQIVELGGPEVKTLREIMAFVCEVIGRKRLLVAPPPLAARAAAYGIEIANTLTLGLMPKELVITRDQLALLAQDNVVSEQAVAQGRTLHGLGLPAEAMETIASTYLARFRKTGQFARERIV